MSKKTILIVDDELNIRDGLADAVEMEGYSALKAGNGKEALAILGKENADMIITDLKMPVMSGGELLKKVYASYPTIPVVVLTGHGTIEDAVLAMQNGAVDFLTKPVNLDHLFVLIKKCLSNKEIVEKNHQLQKELDDIKSRNSYSRIIGKSQSVVRLLDTIQQVAPTRASVLITGESGVGKELVADAIVNFSDRKDAPFIKVHCAALNANLLENELFGHVKGAYTGAISDKAGRFEQANGGTIFLDEIGEIDLSTQIKLLRVLQEREFERVGGDKTIKVDVRVISATNKNLEEEIKKGNFREDLYYRLNVVNLSVPPLRERKEDLFLLCTNFLNEFSKENGREITGFSAEAKAALGAYSWPGNIRELRNCVESAVVMCKGSTIELSDLPISVSRAEREGLIPLEVGQTLEEAEKAFILGTLALCKGNRTKAAQMLGIGRKTMYRKLVQYNVEGAENGADEGEEGAVGEGEKGVTDGSSNERGSSNVGSEKNGGAIKRSKNSRKGAVGGKENG